MTARRPDPVTARTGWPALLALSALLLLLGAGVRALRFVAPFHWPFHWDETIPATPALRLLAGALPITAGPEYFGAAPWYPLAPWFAVAGTSTVALDLYSYGIGLLILWTTWLLLRRFLDGPADLFGLAILAVPPLFLAQWSLMTANHVPNLLLGNLCLLASHTIFVADPGRRRALLVFGLVAGLGWWTSPLILVYLAPFAVLTVRTGLLLRPRIGWALLGLLLGGLPQWLYEVLHFPSTKFALHAAGGVPVAPFHERLAATVSGYLPRLIGFWMDAGSPWRLAFFLIVVPLWIAAVVTALVRDRTSFAWLLGRRGGLEHGQVMLWIVAAANLGLLLATNRAIDHYYLLPLYSVLPCWMGGFLGQLRRRGPLIAGAALACLLAVNGWANWQDSVGNPAPGGRRWTNLTRRVQPVLSWLEARGVERAYLTGAIQLLASGMTYLAGERVILADLWREPFVDYGRLVDAAVNPPIVSTGGAVRPLRDSLQGIGVGFRETAVDGLHVLQPAPRFSTTFVPLPRDRWTITASHRSERAADLLDGDAATSWTTGLELMPGQWLEVDLGATELVARVDLLAIDWQDLPGGFRVEVSPDGSRWDTVVTVSEYWGPLFFSEHHPFLRVRRGRVQAVFPPVRARRVRIVQTASVRYHIWSARELFVYGPGGPRPPVLPAGELTAALRREGISFVYASHWLSARVKVESRGTIGAQESNINVSDASRTEPDPVELVPVRLEKAIGILLGADADAAGVRAALGGQSVSVRETTAGPYPLLLLEPAPPPHRLGKSGWRASASASEGGGAAQRAVDGDRGTAWTSGRPGGPDTAITIDLGRPQAVRSVEVRPGLPGRELRLSGSPDGVTWTPLSPLAWAGAVYWTGTELLRNGGPRWAVTFPRTTLRFLRLSPAGPLRDPWTIVEVECLE
jgi:F5/8 type C domain-containing protein